MPTFHEPELIPSTPPFPDAVFAQHLAILGKTGAGKSYAARGFLEYLIANGHRAVVIDPTAVHYGIRLHPDGNPIEHGPLSRVSVLGAVQDQAARYQDAPIYADSGETVARGIIESPESTVIAMRHLSVGGKSRFFTEFAETLLARNRQPLHVVIDECHRFMPQSGGRGGFEQTAMLHAANELVSGGRSSGLRIWLLSQRPAKVHKDSLTQVETLIAMKCGHVLDRNAVEAWINAAADKAKGREIIASLPGMKTGTGWIWSPEHDVLLQHTFPRIQTYDSMRPLDPGEAHATLDHFPTGNQAVVHALIREHEQRLAEGEKKRAPGKRKSPAKAPPTPSTPPPRQPPARAPRPQIPSVAIRAPLSRENIAQVRREMKATQAQLADAAARLAVAADITARILRHADAFLLSIDTVIRSAEAGKPEPELPESNGARPHPETPATGNGEAEPDLAELENDPLIQIARQVWPARLNWSQLCSCIGRKASGGHFGRTRKRLLDAGLVRMRENARVELTDPPDLGDTVPADALERNLPEPARKMFAEIRAAAGGHSVESLAATLGMTPRGGHWTRGMSMLRKADLIETDRHGRLNIHPDLYQPETTEPRP